MRNAFIGGIVGLVVGAVIGATVLAPQFESPAPHSPPSGPAAAKDFITIGTGGAAKIIDMELRDIGGEGRIKSFVLFIFDDHALRETT